MSTIKQRNSDKPDKYDKNENLKAMTPYKQGLKAMTPYKQGLKAMTLIGIDGNEANEVQKVGVSQYAFELLWNIYRILDRGRKKYKDLGVIVYLKSNPSEELPQETSFWKYKVIGGGKIWIITKLMPYLWRPSTRPDVFFAPSHYLPPILAVPKVCTIHDLGYLRFSGQFTKYDYWQLKLWSAISIFISKYVLAVSNSTKEDIVRHYPFASKKVMVTHHGYDRKRFNPMISDTDVRRVKKRYSIVEDYLLFLSTLKPSKNIEGILSAFGKLVKSQSQNLTLVISGKKGWLYKTIFRRVKEHNLEEKVIFTDYLPESDKPALIAGAKMLVSPSFWEGFGMHVLEALASGTPVVVSRVASLPEVVGEAGIYVDPESINSIAKGIGKVLSMSEIEYNKLVKRGLKQAQRFSWEKTAEVTLAALVKAKK